MQAGSPFFNLYSHDLVRVAVGVPAVRVADPAFNAEQTIELMEQAADERAVVVLFPELGLSAYSCDDLFHQRALLDACQEALARIVEASRDLQLVAVVGLPLLVDHLLFNCAAVVSRGRILGVVPEDLPAELPRVLRGAPVHPRATPRIRDEHRPARPARRAVRQPPAVPGRGAAAADLPRRDLRGRLGADPAVARTRRWPARRSC